MGCGDSCGLFDGYYFSVMLLFFKKNYIIRLKNIIYLFITVRFKNTCCKTNTNVRGQNCQGLARFKGKVAVIALGRRL